MHGSKYNQIKRGLVMREVVDGTMAYVIALMATFSTALWTHADQMVTVGGIVVLGCRLYVDGGRAIRKWRYRNG